MLVRNGVSVKSVSALIVILACEMLKKNRVRQVVIEVFTVYSRGCWVRVCVSVWVIGFRRLMTVNRLRVLMKSWVVVIVGVAVLGLIKAPVAVDALNRVVVVTMVRVVASCSAVRIELDVAWSMRAVAERVTCLCCIYRLVYWYLLFLL